MRALLVALLLAPLAAQSSRPASAPPGEREARAALKALAERHVGAKTLSARYVQVRTTPLRKTPLESRGELLFRASPGCIVFAVKEPSDARIRLDENAYEVWRPQSSQLERFVLGRPDLARALFDSLLADWDQLSKRLALGGVTASPDQSRLRVRMVPREEAMRPYLTALELVVAADGSRLHEIAYDDGQGDHVALVLDALEIDPKLEAGAFELQLPPGAKVLEHAPPPKTGAGK
jgi:outer membrane lipoprotein-sorting protein